MAARPNGHIWNPIGLQIGVIYVTCQVEPDVTIVELEGSSVLAHGWSQTRAEKQEIIGLEDLNI
jgi:hypothetical protein